MKRRDFVKSVLMSPLFSMWATPFWKNVAMAQATSHFAPNVLMVRLRGALDTVQGLNPWVGTMPRPEDLYLGYDHEVIKKLVARPVLEKINSTEINLGPSAQGLAEYAQDIALVNGIFMGPSDLGHPFALQYISSGRTQEKAPHLSTIVAHRRREQNDFLLLNSTVEAGTNEFSTLLVGNLLQGFTLTATDANDLFELIQKKTSAQQGFDKLVAKKDSIERFNSVLKELNPTLHPQFVQSSLPGQSGQGSQPEKSESTSTQNGQTSTAPTARTSLAEEVIVAAFASGLATVAQMDIGGTEGGNVDSHFNYINEHPQNQKRRWDRIANLIGNLKKLNILDKTLVIVVSEFNRTPDLNSNAGKDHNYFDNSALLAGYGTRGGVALGGHRLFGKDSPGDQSLLVADFVDYATGEIHRPNVSLEQLATFHHESGTGLIRPRDLLTTCAAMVLPESKVSFGDDCHLLTKVMR